MSADLPEQKTDHTSRPPPQRSVQLSDLLESESADPEGAFTPGPYALLNGWKDDPNDKEPDEEFRLTESAQLDVKIPVDRDTEIEADNEPQHQRADCRIDTIERLRSLHLSFKLGVEFIDQLHASHCDIRKLLPPDSFERASSGPQTARSPSTGTPSIPSRLAISGATTTASSETLPAVEEWPMT